MFGRRRAAPPPPRLWLAAARERLLRVEDAIDDHGDRAHPDLPLLEARKAVLRGDPGLRRAFDLAVSEVKAATDAWHAAQRAASGDLVRDIAGPSSRILQ